MVAGVRDLEITRSDVEAIRAELKDDNDIYIFKHRMHLLIRILEAGKRALGWKAYVPAPPVIINRDPPTFTPDYFRGLASLRTIEATVLKHIASKAFPPGGSAEIGLMLYSAVVYGGLLDLEWIPSWLRSIPSGARLDGDVFWVDIEKTAANKYSFETGDKSETFRIIRRWFADPLTQSLMLRWLAGNPDQPDLRPDEYLAALWKAIGQPRKTAPDLKTLVKWSSVRLSLYLPQYLVVYAKGDTKSVSLSPSAWTRLRTEKAVSTGAENGGNDLDSSPSNAKTVSIPASDGSEDADRQHGLLDELLKEIVPPGRKTREANSDVRRRVEEFISDNSHEFAPMMHLLADWTIEHLKRKTRRPPWTIKAQVRPDTIRGYIRTIGKQLVAEAIDADLGSFESEDYRELYLSVVNKKEVISRRYLCGLTLYRFHLFLMDHYGAPRVDFNNIAARKLGPPEASVDANVISPAMFKKALALLDTSGGSDRLSQIRLLITILGFRCGLRRNEARNIRLRDIHGSNQPELLVRSSRYAVLKSSDSLRRVPMHLLLDKDELRMFTEWMSKRRKEDADITAPVFAEPGSRLPVPEEMIFPQIHKALRAVSGDDRLRFHHLRHSFANWLLLCLVGNPAAPGLPRFPFMKNYNGKSRDGIVQRLLGNEHLGRPALYSVSMLCGHASPATTLLNYTHLCDFMLGRALWQEDAQPEIGEPAIKKITSLSTATMFRNQERLANKRWIIGPHVKGIVKKLDATVSNSLNEPLDARARNTGRSNIVIAKTSSVERYSWRLIHAALEKYLHEGEDEDKVLEMYKISKESFAMWRVMAEKTSGLLVATSNRASKRLIPAKPHGNSDLDMADKIMSVCEKLADSKRPDTLYRGLKVFLSSFRSKQNDVFARNSGDLVAWLQFLAAMPVSRKHIVLTHYPARGVDVSESIVTWRMALAGAKINIAIECDASGKYTKGSHGAVGVKVLKPPKKTGGNARRDASNVFTFALHMALLAFGAELGLDK